MRKLFILSIGIVILLGSCKKDPLDITPDGRMSLEDVFKSSDLTPAYLNSCYAWVRKYGHGYHYYTFLTSFTDDATDSQVPTDSWHQLQSWYNDAFSASNMPFMAGSATQLYNDMDLYARNWMGIRKTNVFINNVTEQNIPDPTTRARLLAEAKTLRAHYYWDLIKMFGPMPIIDKDLIGEQDFSSIKRASFDECTQFIVKDCDEAIATASFPLRAENEPDRGRMTKAVAYAVKSMVTLFNASPLWNLDNNIEKWKAAADAAKQAVEGLASNGYALYPDYEKYFLTRPDKAAAPGDKETILEATDGYGYGTQTYRAFGSITYLMHMIPTFPSEKPGCSPTQELVDAYEMKDGTIPILGYNDADHSSPVINSASGYDDQHPYVNRDPRFYASIWYNGAYFGVVNGAQVYIESYVGGAHGISGIKQRSPTGYYLRKYVDPAMRNNGTSKTLFRIYRLGELYLNLAEAENEANGPTTIAYSAVNTVRARAKMPDLPAGMSKEEFRERIRRERRVETAIEEDRYYDSRRWGSTYFVNASKVKTGMRWIKAADGSLSNTRIVVVKPKMAIPKYLLMPIPLGETIRMPGMTQNPGW